MGVIDWKQRSRSRPETEGEAVSSLSSPDVTAERRKAVQLLREALELSGDSDVIVYMITAAIMEIERSIGDGHDPSQN